MINLGGQGQSHRGTLPQGDTRFWFGLRVILAVFFLAAAFLKWQAFVSGVPSAVSEVAPQLEWGLIQFEFLLAIWLLSTLTNAMSEYAWPSWTGQYLVTSPSVADLGVGKPGEWRDFRVRVQNRAAEPIRLIGAANDCQCSAERINCQ